MDNINDIINNLTDDDMSKLQEMAQSMFGGEKEKPSASESIASDLGLPNIDLSKIQSLMQTVKGEDDRTRLIGALKPMLSQKRQKKADEAMKLLRLFRLLPVIQSSGLLKGFLEDI